MQKSVRKIILIPLVVSFAISISSNGQQTKIDEVAALYSNTQVVSNIEYKKIDSVRLLLDVYVPAKRLGESPWVEYSNDRKPTLLFLHGGGWTSGDKISRSLFLMPYISKGWCIVTANYRHLDQASITGIIGDARSALNWVYENADKYKFDTGKIIVSGESAGGHLALMTGFVTNDAPFQQEGKKINRRLKVAGIINWFGVADLAKASSSWDATFYKQVVGDSSHAGNIFQLSSPVNYITSASPPVITIHGDQDKAAPYNQALLLHNRLKEAGVKNYLFTVLGKKHGNFDNTDMTAIYKEIWQFLSEIGI
ncbi:MAG: alpha/beta hydrolase [Ginsengibacter sp.]